MPKPQQYIKGYAEFYKLRFKATPDVLIPRPETELLVDEVLSHINVIVKMNEATTKQSITVLDVGTGAGNIAISIARNLPLNSQVQIIATDISEKALTIARQNAMLHGVADGIVFLKSDLLKNPALHSYILNTKYSILVTNLPYIPSYRIPYLDSSVKDFEPLIALDGGGDGFDLYRKLFRQITDFSLPPRGWKPKLIVGEIDYTQAEIAIKEADKYFPEARAEVKLDLAHRQRILSIRR